jgi:hypothetical protein
MGRKDPHHCEQKYFNSQLCHKSSINALALFLLGQMKSNTQQHALCIMKIKSESNCKIKYDYKYIIYLTNSLTGISSISVPCYYLPPLPIIPLTAGSTRGARVPGVMGRQDTIG